MKNDLDVKRLIKPDELGKLGDVPSIKKVSEEIQQTIDVVDLYKGKLDTIETPMVKGEPWYKLCFNRASKEQVNLALSKFSDFVVSTFKNVAFTQNLQNENDTNICKLVALLAIAEANSYDKISNLSEEVLNLSEEDKETANQLKKLQESFNESINNESDDAVKKEQQIIRVVDYVTLFAENKTNQLKSIFIKLSNQDKDIAQLKSNISKYAKLTTASLIIGGLSFAGMVAMFVKFVLLSL